MASKKIYVQVAGLLAGERALYAGHKTELRLLDNLTHSLGDIFTQDSMAFDRDKFYAAAGLNKEVNNV